MSRESHNCYIQQAALREAQKALDNNKPGSLSRVSFGQLRIQTVEPWKRILLGTIALIALGSGVVLIYAASFWAGVFVGAAGLGLLLFAAFGRKKTIDALDGADVIHLAAQLFDAF